MNQARSRVFLNWRMNLNDRESNYATMADGYRLAVRRLFNSLLDDNSLHEADAVIYPVIFCAHQCAELYLKAIIIALSEVQGRNPWAESIPNTHSFNELIDAVNKKFDNKDECLIRNPGTETFYKMLDLFNQLGVTDSYYHPDFARYPENAPTKNHPRKEYPFVTDDSLVFHIQELANILNDGCEFIEGWYLSFAHQLDDIRVPGANNAAE